MANEISKIKLPGGTTEYAVKDNSAITDITRSGTTFTATKRDGTTFTFTQQDNNTTYTFATGDNNGQIKVTPSGGTAQNVSVKGLGAAAYKGTTTSVTSGSSDLVTSGAVYTAIDNLPEPMIFKGSLGTGGTITTLPTASSANEGFTYKVITAGTYASQVAKVGDLFISNGTDWIWIPSGDEPSGTVTSVAIANGGGLSVSGSPITSSGTITISHADTSSQASVDNSGRTYIQDITLDTYGHVTKITSATETVVNTDRYVNSAAFANDTSGVKMTLTRAGSDTATVTGTIPLVSSSTAGVAPKGTAVSSQSQSTKFLREDGTWAAPSYTTNTNTTYTLSVGTGDDANKIILTPSSGTANKITVPYAMTAGSATTATSATSATSATTASKATAANLTTTQYGVAYYTNTTGTFGNNPCLITTSTGGLEVKGMIAGDSGSTGHGLYGGGGYHNAYNNILLHGDASTGSSGIAFVSDKITASTGAVTNINQPSDRAFIQYHACGITTATAEGTNPTLATSGETGRLVIGIGNDATDQIWLQTPGRTGLIHQVGATSYVIPDTNNTTGSVGSATNPVYVADGIIKGCTYSLNKTVPSDAVFTDHYAWSDITGKPSSFTPASHTHGNIQNGGTLQTNDITIASGDKLVVTDSSDSNKVARASISFDGSTTTKCLTQKGTWETFSNTNTTYTLSADTTNNKIKLTPSSGNAQSITVPYATSAGSATEAAKVTISDGSDTTQENYIYYPVLYGNASGTTSGTGTLKAIDGLRYHAVKGSTSVTGKSILELGNNIATGTEGNKYGLIRIYAQSQAYSNLVMSSESTVGRTHTLPNEDGTISVFTATPTSGQVVITDGTYGGIKSSGYTIAKSVPSNAVFTDTNNAVTQTATTTSANYELLFSGTADNTTRTEGARKTDSLKYNPSTKELTLNGTVVLNGYTRSTSTDPCPSIILKANNIDTDTAVSARTYSNSEINVHDKDGDRLGFVNWFKDTDGSIGFAMSAQNKSTGGTNYYNTLEMRVDKTGNRAYSISDAKAFRSAINTTTCSFTKSISSLAGATIVRRGNVVTLEFGHQITSAGSYTNIGTVSPAPIETLHFVVNCGSSWQLARINTAGVVSFNNATSVAANAYLIGSCTYITAD